MSADSKTSKSGKGGKESKTATSRIKESKLKNSTDKNKKQESKLKSKPVKKSAGSKRSVKTDPSHASESEFVHAELVEPTESAESSELSTESKFDPEGFRAELESLRDVSIDPEQAESTDPDSVETLETIAKTPGAKGGEATRALTTADPVTIYLAELRKYPLLTKEQERELAVRYKETGDAKAAELLVTSNLRFVVKIAAEYSRFGAKLIDLIQEGNVGLMHAVREFNPYKGVRLITYAVWWIRGYIQDYLMRQYSLVRIGTTQNQRKLFYRLQKERATLGQSGQEPNHALLAGRLGVTEDEVASMAQRLSGRDVSLSQPLSSNGDSNSTLLDYEATGEVSIDEALGTSEELAVLKENIAKIRSGLSEKELYILELRLLADDPMTLQEIGEHYGVTREAVRQLEVRLINKIRSAVTSSLKTSLTNQSEDS